MLEMIISTAFVMLGAGLYISGSLLLTKMMTETNPSISAREAMVGTLVDMLQEDARKADGFFVFAGTLQANGSPFRRTTWSVSGTPAYTTSATEALTALTAGYALTGIVLTNVAPVAGQDASTILFLNADGRVRALWEFRSYPGTTDGIAGLWTEVVRYADVGGGALLDGGQTYAQWIPGATLLAPGGKGPNGASRALPGARVLPAGVAEVVFPAPMTSDTVMPYDGGSVPESVAVEYPVVRLTPSLKAIP